jgi:hypothetical protein
MSEANTKETVAGYQLCFWIVGVQPIVWRRLLLRPENTLADLHHAIQITCNWSDDFLHQFNIHGKTIGVPRIHGPYYSLSAGKVTLANLNLRETERFGYEYNFFDHWQLEIRLEKKCDLDTKRLYPFCIAGKRAAPPESCGGSDRFNQLRDHFSPYYIMDQVLAWYQLFERREQLSEDELYELEDRRFELSRLRYWTQVEKFEMPGLASRRLAGENQSPSSYRA